MKNVFNKEVSQKLINRIEKLDSSIEGKWGKMSVSQMLAHCNVTYEMVYDNIHPKPGGFKRALLKLLVKNAVVGDKPYSPNGRTAPVFIKEGKYDFDKEKSRLMEYVKKTTELGEGLFQDKESLSFGRLSSSEWSNMFYKHLDHHLTQFGV